MDQTDLWDFNYQKCIYYVKNDKTVEQSQDVKLKSWYDIWNRAYKNKRMTKPEYIEKWETLIKLQKYLINIKVIEDNYFKNSIVPSVSSKNAKERNLALWMSEQDDPEKCFNVVRWDTLKSNYKELFNQE
jgi:hypothetical protein